MLQQVGEMENSGYIASKLSTYLQLATDKTVCSRLVEIEMDTCSTSYRVVAVKGQLYAATTIRDGEPQAPSTRQLVTT